MSANPSLLNARIVASFGRNFIAQCQQTAQQYQCTTRGKRTGIAIGDYVKLRLQGAEQAVIEEIIERKNLLYRSDNQRSKLFAANIDRLLFVLAPEPDFSLELTGRAHIAAINAGVKMMIVLNKADLPAIEQARKKLQPLKEDRKSTRLNSSHVAISYAVFCLKKKKKREKTHKVRLDKERMSRRARARSRNQHR